MSNASSSFLYYQTSTEAIPESSTEAKSRSSSINNDNGAHYTCDDSFLDQRKRRRVGSSLSSVQSEKIKEVKSTKRKKPFEEQQLKAGEEPPGGYIHVRARRGQATDSHSLAERVRREKISERMKMLKGLVPGCEKVVGKALMLDEIINYVQSLQNQIEFLSMKLSCMNPVLHDFPVHYGCSVNQTELVGFMREDSQAIQGLMQDSLIQGTAKAYQTMIPPPPVLKGQGNDLPEDDINSLMQVGDRRQGFLNEVVHMRSFG